MMKKKRLKKRNRKKKSDLKKIKTKRNLLQAKTVTFVL